MLLALYTSVANAVVLDNYSKVSFVTDMNSILSSCNNDTCKHVSMYANSSSTHTIQWLSMQSNIMVILCLKVVYDF